MRADMSNTHTAHTDTNQALRDAHRVLRPGGRFMCLEFRSVCTRAWMYMCVRGRVRACVYADPLLELQTRNMRWAQPNVTLTRTPTHTHAPRPRTCTRSPRPGDTCCRTTPA